MGGGRRLGGGRLVAGGGIHMYEKAKAVRAFFFEYLGFSSR